MHFCAIFKFAASQQHGDMIAFVFSAVVPSIPDIYGNLHGAGGKWSFWYLRMILHRQVRKIPIVPSIKVLNGTFYEGR